jgi:UDP-glucose 4-epimerase
MTPNAAPAYAHDWAREFGSFFSGRTVLVTGSTGFVGGHVCTALTQLGADVHGVSFAEPEAPSPDQPWPVHEMDARDEGSVLAAVVDAGPDTVFHLAGIVDTDRRIGMVAPTMHGNLVSTVNVLLAASKTGCRRVVVPGSAEELVDPETGPLSPYAASKMALGPYLRLFRSRYGASVASVRPFVSYGPGQVSGKLIPYAVLELLADRDPVISSGERVCDFVFIGDLVRGILASAALDEAPSGTIDIGTGKGTTIRSVVERIAGVVGSQASPRFARGEGTPLEPPQIAFEHGERLPGWAPVWDLEEGLRLTCEWYGAPERRGLEESL